MKSEKGFRQSWISLDGYVPLVLLSSFPLSFLLDQKRNKKVKADISSSNWVDLL
jgi:hypothetical protein